MTYDRVWLALYGSSMHPYTNLFRAVSSGSRKMSEWIGEAK